MNDKNIEIGLNTKADLSGAKQAQEAIRDVGRESEKVNREEQERAKEQANNVSQIRNQTIAQSIDKVGQYATQAASGVRDLAAEIAKVDPQMAKNAEKVAAGFDGVATSAQGAAMGMAALGPPGAAIGAVVAPAIGALGGELRAAAESALALENALQVAAGMPDRIAKAAKAITVSEQIESWKILVAEIRDAGKEAENLSKIATARRGLEEYRAQAEIEIAKAGGGNVAAAESNLRSIQASNLRAANDEKIQTAVNQYEAARLEYFNAQSLATADRDTLNQEQRGMVENIRKYRETLDQTIRELEAARAQAEVSTQRFEIDSGKTNRLNEIQQQKKNQSLTVDNINQLVDAIGDNGSDELRNAMQQLRVFASDGKLSADELQKANTLLAQFTNQILNLAQKQQGLFEDAGGKIRVLEAGLDQLQRDMNNMKTNAAQGPRW